MSAGPKTCSGSTSAADLYEPRLARDATQIVRFRSAIGEAGAKKLFKATIDTAVDVKSIKPAVRWSSCRIGELSRGVEVVAHCRGLYCVLSMQPSPSCRPTTCKPRHWQAAYRNGARRTSRCRTARGSHRRP